MLNHMPVIGTGESWCLYMDTDESALNGEVGHRCPGFLEAYAVTSAFYFLTSTNKGTEVRFTCKKCEGCGEALPEDLSGFIHMFT